MPVPQHIAGYLFLAAAVVLGAGFVFVALSAGKGPASYESVTHTGYRIRRYWAGIVVVLALIAVALTIPHMPYPIARGTEIGPAATTVQVRGQQWQWTITPDTVPAGETIKFDVTSADVNHGFAIYDPQGNIVGNVQAMPRYQNRLYLRFASPGVYQVRCLELCGLYHTAMVSQITVTPAKG
jgi:cytochrome c oxidase subunit II